MVLLFLGVLVAGGHKDELAATVTTPLVKVGETVNCIVELP